MISSMTGFARNEIKMYWGEATWEIRTVNHRYLEVNCRLPDGFRDLELALRENLRKFLARGKIDIYLNLKLQNHAAKSIVNKVLVKQLLDACNSVYASSNKVSSINPMDIIRWPGVLEARQLNLPRLKSQLLTGFCSTLRSLIRVRNREGKTLVSYMRQRLAKIETYTKDIKSRLPHTLKGQRSLLKKRLYEVQKELDKNRVEQEMVMFAQKIDVAEELHRLCVHVKEVNRILKGKGNCGRRLDFLMQELNREANTIASKSVDAIITRDTVEIKVLIEQMREQVQNIE